MPPQSTNHIFTAQAKEPEDKEVENEAKVLFEKKDPLLPREYKIIWFNVLMLVYLQLGAVYGLYLAVASASFKTTLLGFFLLEATLVGVAGGAHRCWSHRSYKAKLPLRILFAVLHLTAFQESIFMWVKNHRLHHKYSDDDADPYNPRRGPFFAHIGWLLVEKHPRYVEKGRKLDLSDILSDPVVVFEKKYYWYLMVLFCFIIPTVAPMYLWQETFWNAYFVNILRQNLGVHCAMAINSIAHYYGDRPYDKKIGPANNYTFNFFSVGEGAHNYHHVFPWDYRSVEMSTFYFNLTTWFIDAMAKLGLAYDLKTANSEMVEKRVKRTGDETCRPKKLS